MYNFHRLLQYMKDYMNMSRKKEEYVDTHTCIFGLGLFFMVWATPLSSNLVKS